MKIDISQQNKKISIEFQQGNIVGKYKIDKADYFLAAIDRFINKRKVDITVLKKADLNFVGTGILTERIIRAIMKGLNF